MSGKERWYVKPNDLIGGWCDNCGKRFALSDLPADWPTARHNCWPGRDVVACLLDSGRIRPVAGHSAAGT